MFPKKDFKKPTKNFDKRPGQFGNRSEGFGDKPRRFGERTGRFNDRPGRFNDAPRSEDKPNNFSRKPPRFGDKPVRFGDRPARFGDRPPKFGDRPASFDRKPGRFGDRPPRFSDKPANFERKSDRFEEKRRFDGPRKFDAPRRFDKPREFNKPGRFEDNSKPGANNTSWSKVSEWYDEHLQDTENYHNQVIFPQLATVVKKFVDRYPKKEGFEVLDVACGQGGWAEFLLRQSFATGWKLSGADLAAPLVELAQAKHLKNANFIISAAEKLTEVFPDKQFDLITCVLALQNMPTLDKVFSQVAALLEPKGEFTFVITHPAFRVPKHSDWVDDARLGKIYRGTEKYMSALRIPISSRPFKSTFGKAETETTWTFHRPLSDYVRDLARNNLAVIGMQEWVSHKKSESANPKASQENAARKEIPMFMCVTCRKIV